MNEVSLTIWCTILTLFLFIRSSEGSYDYSDLSGQLSLMKRCETQVVYVSRMYLTCDSNDEEDKDNDSNGSYQKSSRCKYGDTANMHIFFSISESYAWDGIQVTIDAGVLASYTNVESETDLCDMKELTYLGSSYNEDEDDDNNNAQNEKYCPTAGDYLLEWSFEVPAGGGDKQLQYNPDVRIKFESDDGTRLGCAGSGTVATVQNASMHQRRGEIALGIALTLIFFIFSICLCLAYRRKKQVEEERRGKALQRYYFARNSHTGELVPIPNRGWGSPVLPPNHPHYHHHHEADASTLSSYNEGSAGDHQYHLHHHPYPLNGTPMMEY